MGHEGTLHLGGTDAMARHVKNVIDPPSDPNEPVLVASTSISGEVVARIGLHVHSEIALVITEAGSRNARPGLLDGQDTLNTIAFNFLTSRRIKDDGVNAVERQGTRSRLHRGASRQIGHDVSTRLGLPVGINNGTVLVADDFVVPPPSLWIDGLPDRAQDPQTGQVVLFGNVVPKPHQRTDGRGGGVEDGYLVTLDHVPVPTIVGVHGRTLEHEGAQPVEEGSVHDVGMAGNPPGIGNAGVDVRLLQIERSGRGMHGIKAVTCRGMDESLRLAGTAGGVEDEQIVLGIHPLARTVRTLLLD
mmetsp:Transcript_5326/g.11589  ORF Transcript_5326/g.11589 Transcript_5326/m.11589 type:complete len:302 (-) Transcript_5326:853-1758(-)